MGSSDGLEPGMPAVNPDAKINCRKNLHDSSRFSTLLYDGKNT